MKETFEDILTKSFKPSVADISDREEAHEKRKEFFPRVVESIRSIQSKLFGWMSLKPVVIETVQYEKEERHIHL